MEVAKVVLAEGLLVLGSLSVENRRYSSGGLLSCFFTSIFTCLIMLVGDTSGSVVLPVTVCSFSCILLMSRDRLVKRSFIAFIGFGDWFSIALNQLASLCTDMGQRVCRLALILVFESGLVLERSGDGVMRMLSAREKDKRTESFSSSQATHSRYSHPGNGGRDCNDSHTA